jgi:general secretion pathway protein A
MYYEYWGLKKAPFDNVPDPTMYVDAHASVENAIAETLFAIEEGNECIAVIVGDIGLGKTLSLRLILDSLEQERYKVALITNPDMSFVQLMREIIGQLTGKQCETRRKVDLLETFNKVLFETVDEGKKVLIFIDEANAMSPMNLESLRLLTNMQDDSRNLFTLVLAGQIELAKRLEHPKRANLFQRIGTYSRIDKIESETLVGEYVRTRMRLAGGTNSVFTDDAIHNVWEYSEHGVPRLINKMCKLSLKAGETNGFATIDGEVVRQIGERFQKLTASALQKRRPRKRFEGTVVKEPVDIWSDEETSADGNGTQAVALASESEPVVNQMVPPEVNREVMDEIAEEMSIGAHRIKVEIPLQMIRDARSSSTEARVKLAGSLAAHTMQAHPQLTVSSAMDPVSVWHDIRTHILNAFEREAEAV